MGVTLTSHGPVFALLTSFHTGLNYIMLKHPKLLEKHHLCE